MLKFLPDGPRDAPWLNDEERGIITARLASDDTSQHRNFWLALRDPRVYALGVVYFGYSIAFYGVGLWMPQIVQGMGVSNLMTGFAIAPAYFVAMIAMILWGRSSDKRGERVWHVALPALMMMTAFLIGSVAHDNLVIFLMLSLVLVGSMALQGPFWVLPSSFLGGAAAAGGIALINTMGTAAGGFAGPYILGLIKQATGGYAAGMAALAIGPLLTASIVLDPGARRPPRGIGQSGGVTLRVGCLRIPAHEILFAALAEGNRAQARLAHRPALASPPAPESPPPAIPPDDAAARSNPCSCGTSGRFWSSRISSSTPRPLRNCAALAGEVNRALAPGRGGPMPANGRTDRRPACPPDGRSRIAHAASPRPWVRAGCADGRRAPPPRSRLRSRAATSGSARAK